MKRGAGHGLSRVLGVIALLTATPWLVTAGDPRGDDGEGIPGRVDHGARLVATAEVALEPLRLRELLGPGGSVRRMDASLPQPVPALISRAVPTLWRYRAPRRSIDDGTLRVSYRVFDLRGRPGRLGLAESPDSTIRVEINEIPFREVGSLGRNVVVAGGAVFKMNLERIHKAGTYRGSVVVTITHF
ncbi:MAG: hypothetical protein GY716_08365 [bacterium]|nr:hypothetical protein [bacterium]